MPNAKRLAKLRTYVGRGQRWRTSEKAGYLAKFEASGLSAAEFRRKTGVPRSTFALWRRQAKGASRKGAGKQSFARVEVIPAAVSSEIVVVVRSGSGVVAELRGLDRAVAVSLLEALLVGSAR